MSVSDWFSTFCSELVVQNASSISTRYRNITGRLNKDFWATDSDTAHSIYVGSYGRETAVNGTSDLDMAVWLPWSLYSQYSKYQTGGQSAFLQAVRTSIVKRYPNTRLGADGQVVALNFDDGMQFEVLPCFEHSDGSFTHADTNGGGSWPMCNPRAEIDAMNTRNTYTANGNLRRVCRMMREWKKKWDVPIPGILIDTLAYQFILTYEHREKSYMWYDWFSRDFFAYMAEQDRTQEHWRAPGSGRYVYRAGNFEYKATRCRNIAIEAIEAEGKNYHHTAKSKWREIYGNAFPS
jgi:Second Messenger Oligonucleotide or Dinucleotide Synthetase domain